MFEALTFLSILLLALSAGAAFTHVLEIPGKRRLTYDTVVAIYHNLYIGYRYTGLAIESATLAVLIGAAVVALGDGTAFWLVITALAADLGTAVVFAAWTDRENRRFAAWRVGQPPPHNWTYVLGRWEFSHGIRALLFLSAIGLLLGALVAG